MKIYLDQNRIYVVPEVKDAGINKFGVRVGGKCVVTNIRLAEGGGMNMIGQKFTDAKIVTHGINFDVDKATINRKHGHTQHDRTNHERQPRSQI